MDGLSEALPTKRILYLPKRLLKDAHRAGPSAGVVVNLRPMLEEYYAARGWSPEGIPSPEKLQWLGSHRGGGLF